MTRPARTLQMIVDFARVLAISAGLSLAAAWPAGAVEWTDETDAIKKLWQGRSGAGDGWDVKFCDAYASIPTTARALTTNTGSGLVVPQVRVGVARMTDNLTSMARALLYTDLTSNATGAFVPVDSNPNKPFKVMDAQFWANLLRSPHGDELGRLPAPASTLPDPPVNCPAGLAAADRLAVVNALNNVAPPVAGMTNRMKWHCYANRFRLLNNRDDIGIPGFVEITHFEYVGATQYKFAAAQGRLVFDYINQRVFYTPAHYQRWDKQTFAPIADNDKPAPGSFCNPFFQIVK